MKAADIPDDLFLAGVRALRQPSLIVGYNQYYWVMRWDIDKWLSEQLGVEVPWKVSLAKARKADQAGPAERLRLRLPR